MKTKKANLHPQKDPGIFVEEPIAEKNKYRFLKIEAAESRNNLNGKSWVIVTLFVITIMIWGVYIFMYSNPDNPNRFPFLLMIVFLSVIAALNWMIRMMRQHEHDVKDSRMLH